MKKNVIAAAALCLAAGTPVYSFSANPCEVVLECRSAEKAFFKIVKKNKHGFLPNHTLKVRKAFLGECPDADPKTVNKILSRFGKVRG